MNKRLLVLFTLLLSYAASFSQQNLSLVGQLDYALKCNDVWGYVAPDSTEYALVGVNTGVSIVSLADPANPVEVDYVSGLPSTWRDMKTWNDYAYVTNEEGGGLHVINMSTLPDSVTASLYVPLVDSMPLQEAHNIYIDEFGFAYIAGAPFSINSGGILIFDLNADPEEPPLVGKGPPVYAHDVFTRDNIMYSSEVYAGVFSIYDVSDKSNVFWLGSSTTPFNFTHNAWISDDSKSIFTTDEKANAPVAAYDISDFTDIKYLHEFRPPATVKKGVIPHNTHVYNDYLVTSYYTDGLVITDASRPSNLVQVGQYDTYPGADGGFLGCWGAYPYLPSGLILASDINTGLYVLQPTYKRACYLEGSVTDDNTGNPLNNASIKILSTIAKTSSLFSGEYKTGHSEPGSYQVEFSKPGYQTEVHTVNLTTGNVIVKDVALTQLPPFQLIGKILDINTNNPIPNAVINLKNDNYDVNVTADATGQFVANTFYEDVYEGFVGKWGYKTDFFTNDTILNDGTQPVFYLDTGLEDIFELDLGWTRTGNATTGRWERGVPIETVYDGDLSNPGNDVGFDLGKKCYVTGNAGGSAPGDDIDDGTTILTSPVFDGTTMDNPYIAYFTWFFNSGGNGSPPNDDLTVQIYNGATTVTVETIDVSQSLWRQESFIRIQDYTTLTPNMQVIFSASDIPAGHIVEAALDYFRVFDYSTTSTNNLEDSFVKYSIFPNPSSGNFTIDFDFDEYTTTNAQLLVHNMLGQRVETMPITDRKGQLSFGERLNTGVYLVNIQDDNGNSKPLKIMKIK